MLRQCAISLGLSWQSIQIYLNTCSPAQAQYNEDLDCIGAIDSNVTLSRPQLSQIIELPVGAVFNQPLPVYCELPSTRIVTEVGLVEARRTLHPFEWEPNNGLIILWSSDGSQFIDYDFRIVK